MTSIQTDSIAETREIGLSFLKPSQRDLEHGLALHRESLVMEPYSLGLHAPEDIEALNRLVDEHCSQREFINKRLEMRMTGWATSQKLRQEYRDAWEASGVTCIGINAGEEGNDPLVLLLRLAHYVALIDAFPDFLIKATTADDIRRAHREGKAALTFALCGVPLSGKTISVEEELHLIHVFAELGARIMHLTYNRRNPLGEGCGESGNAGLSDLGRHAIKEMNRVGVLIDVAHTGWRTCIEAAEVSDLPIIASHTGAWELNHHIRCKPDDVMRAIVRKGGVIGVVNVPHFLGGEGTIVTMLDHIDYIAGKFGVDAVAIGTDRPYLSRYQSDVEQKWVFGRPSWESLWPPDSRSSAEWRQPAQLKSMDWTNWPLFTVGLVQRGYSDEDIKKIIGGNILRVIEQVWRSPIGAV